jgi:hypothetical protein
MVVALVVLILGLITGGLAKAAAGSLPGDTFYPVKRLTENMRLSLTLSSAARTRLQAEFVQERQQEVRSVLDARRSTKVEFQGLLEQKEDGYWIVGGLPVTLDDDTVVEGQPAVGAAITVRAASTQDGTLRAIHLQAEPEPTLEPATESDGTEEPEATDHPQPTEEEELHITATPGPELRETEGLEPTEQPELHSTEEPEPTHQPEPATTHEPEPSHSPEPEESHGPEPTHQTEPPTTYEPEPTHQPGPTELHESEPSPTPTSVPAADN